ncbi:MAG: ABC transporter substrate-binding protein [Deltaproteobacteria bacterium]|nr:ABC transporter substrate-binding protein [Deltaproteobacteria bacterium]
MRRIIVLTAVLVITSLSLSAAQEQKLKVGYSAISGSMAWVWTAKEAGYFDRHGLQVDLVYIGGTVQLFQAMLAGEVAFGVGGGPALIHANLQRRSLVGIAGTLNRMVMKIMAIPQIKGPEDLRGKRIAVTRYGTITDFSARLFLKKWGLSPERDTPLLQVGSIPNVLAALQNGTTHAGALSPPAHLQAEKLGFSELMDLSKEEIYYPYTYVVASAGFLEKNTKSVVAFLQASIEGIHRFKTDKAFAKRVLAKYLVIKDGSILEETHELFSRLFERAPYIKPEGLSSLIQILGEKDPKLEAVKVDSIIDNRFVRELEASGFIKNLYK